jgi:hypothetical protein
MNEGQWLRTARARRPRCARTWAYRSTVPLSPMQPETNEVAWVLHCKNIDPGKTKIGLPELQLLLVFGNSTV